MPKRFPPRRCAACGRQDCRFRRRLRPLSGVGYTGSTKPFPNPHDGLASGPVVARHLGNGLTCYQALHRFGLLYFSQR